MIVQILLLSLGFALLIKGADWLVNGSVSLAKHYNLSELAIGLTIVAFGTSSPELLVNIIASIKGYNDVAMGNIVGSNIFNLMFILGLSGMIYPLSVQSKTVWKEFPLSLLAAVLIILLANNWFTVKPLAVLSRIDGILFIALFLFCLLYIARSIRSDKIVLESEYKIYKPLWTIIFIATGLIALIFGSKLVVNNAVKIAQLLGVTEKLIGLTIVSVGTSLPELVTSVVAVIRKRADIAIGNVIGSNIFNVFFILGISAVINPIKYNLQFNLDILILIVSTILLFIAMFVCRRHKLDRWQAILLAIGYIVYILYVINQ